jgi:hypothetical protein
MNLLKLIRADAQIQKIRRNKLQIRKIIRNDKVQILKIVKELTCKLLNLEESHVQIREIESVDVQICKIGRKFCARS